MDKRPQSFELYGYDFMVDQDFRVWLIEVNSSPSLDTGTSTTKWLVKKVLNDILKVLFDYPQAKNKSQCDTGEFSCVYREKTLNRVTDVKQILCEGKKMHLKRRNMAYTK